MQIIREDPQAHVILATSNYRFLPWLTDSEPFSYVHDSRGLAATHPLVVYRAAGSLPRDRGHRESPRARGAHISLQGLMGQGLMGEVSDSEWASVFEVRDKPSSPLSPNCGTDMSGAGALCRLAGVRGQCWHADHHFPPVENLGRCPSRLAT